MNNYQPVQDKQNGRPVENQSRTAPGAEEAHCDITVCRQRASHVRVRIVYLSRMSVLMPFCWGCVRIVCQSWVRVYGPAHQGFTG